MFILTRVTSFRAREKDVVLLICHTSTSYSNNRWYFQSPFSATQPDMPSHPLGTVQHSRGHKISVKVMSVEHRHWAHIVTMSTHRSLWPGKKRMPELEVISNSKHAKGQEVTLRGGARQRYYLCPSTQEYLSPQWWLRWELGFQTWKACEFCTWSKFWQID